jgi:hypothetical protein
MFFRNTGILEIRIFCMKFLIKYKEKFIFFKENKFFMLIYVCNQYMKKASLNGYSSYRLLII